MAEVALPDRWRPAHKREIPSRRDLEDLDASSARPSGSFLGTFTVAIQKEAS